jgi:hypothetical protein
MIYTIGHTESYLKGFAQAEEKGIPLMKKGRTKDYSGGSVWKTYEEAEAHAIVRGPYSVWGVMADWETETEVRTDVDWNDLLVDAELVKL